MREKLALFIESNFVKEKTYMGSSFVRSKNSKYYEEVCDYSNIDEYIDSNKNENKFQKLLFKYIDDRNLKDSDVYNKVHIDRRLFSKIRSDEDYHPSKDTVILLGLSLELNINEFIYLIVLLIHFLVIIILILSNSLSKLSAYILKSSGIS